MKFRTKYDTLEKVVYSEAGCPIRDVYASKLDKNNNIVVEKKGEENLYDYIQSFKDSVDINVVLKKFAAGDESALMQREGLYTDIVDMPTNLNEFVEFSRNAQQLFDSLPIETKKQYNNNVFNFMEAVNTGEFFKEKEKEILEPLNDVIKEDVKNEIKEEAKELVNE